MIDPVHRRAFLRLLATATAALAGCGTEATPVAPVSLDSCEAWDATGEVPSEECLDLPHLGGAPDTAEGRCIAAFCDTIVPGRHRDPEGAPGAIDSGAPAAFFDPDLPAASLVSLLVALLDAQAALIVEDTTFAALDPDGREAAVQGALDAIDAMTFAVQLVGLVHYSSGVAGCHLGYPGPNAGYYDDPELTFGVAMSEELTTDGNLP